MRLSIVYGAKVTKTELPPNILTEKVSLMEQYIVYKEGFDMGSRLQELLEQLPTGSLTSFVESVGISKNKLYRSYQKKELSVELVKSFCAFADITLDDFFLVEEKFQNRNNKTEQEHSSRPYIEDRVSELEMNYGEIKNEVLLLKKSFKQLADIKFDQMATKKKNQP